MWVPQVPILGPGIDNRQVGMVVGCSIEAGPVMSTISIPPKRSLDGASRVKQVDCFGTSTLRSLELICYSFASIRRPCASCSGRELSLYSAANACNCDRLMLTGCSNTYQRTPSVQGGVVSEPMYVQ